jgi:hypothetical protein
MQNKSFIFWLFNKDKKPVYFDKIVREATGIYKTNGQPAHLEYSPDGWKDTLVKYGRNMKYLGVFRNFTAPMNFKKDGAQIVRDAMWKYGMEALLYLGISKLDRTVYPPKYEPWYVGELDFSKFDQKRDSTILNVMEGGMSKYLKAYEDTTYEIEVDADPQAEMAVMDGLPFTNKIEYEIFNPQTINALDKTRTIGIGSIAQDGSTQGVLNLDQFFQDYDIDSGFMEDDTKFIIPHIEGSIIVDVLDDKPTFIVIRKVNKKTGVSTDYTIINETPSTGSHTYDFSFDIPLEPQDRLFLITTTEAFLGQPLYVIKGGSFTVTYEVTFDQTIIKALKPLRLFQKIVEKMTEGRYTARSNYLASMDDLMITSGSAIRNHEGSTTTLSGSVIQTSLSDFLKSMKIRGVGLGIENDILVMENTSYFFKNDVVVDLGEVSEFEVTVADDIVFNTIKVGYANQDYDSVNGKDEFNVTQNYTTPHTRIVQELDLTSPYRADAYGIELLRVNLDGKDTTDNKSDNDTFFLNVKKGGTFTILSGSLTYNLNGVNTITIPIPFFNPGIINLTGTLNNGTYNIINANFILTDATILTVDRPLADGTENVTITAFSATLYQLNRPAYSSIAGLLHPAKMFNVELSPHTNLLNNGDYIHSILDFQDMNFVKFQAGDKNSDLSRTLNGVTITEKDNVQIAQFAPKLFKPYYFTFKVPTDYNFLKVIQANMYSKLSFTSEGKIYYGYLVDGGVKPATRDVQSLKLLCAPETDLSQLIDTI